MDELFYDIQECQAILMSASNLHSDITNSVIRRGGVPLPDSSAKKKETLRSLEELQVGVRESLLMDYCHPTRQ